MEMNRRGRPKSPWKPFPQQSNSQKSQARAEIRIQLQNLVSQTCGGDPSEVRAILDELYPQNVTPKHENQLKELMNILQTSCRQDATYNHGRWASIPAQVFDLTRNEVRTRFDWNIGKSRSLN